MKNNIFYYYGLISDNIHQNGQTYLIESNHYNYIFMPYYKNINELYMIYKYLIELNIYCHEIINNKNNEVLTIINEKPYILLKIHYNNHQIINLQNIIMYNIYMKKEDKCHWYYLWCQKLDYYEYQVRDYGKKYPLIRDSFSYFDGLCETAISLLNTINVQLKLYLNHQRITKNMNFIDFYNPLNLIIDCRVRDACEYFKIQFFEDNIQINDVTNYLFKSNLSFEEIFLFYIRLLYPSYYFDAYDNIIQGNINEEKLNTYINKIDEFELFLKNIYKLINKYYKLPEIEWIIKT